MWQRRLPVWQRRLLARKEEPLITRPQKNVQGLNNGPVATDFVNCSSLTNLGRAFFPVDAGLPAEFVSELQQSVDGHEDLQHLAATLPGILVASKAPATVRSYTQAFQRWQNWADKYRFTVFPARPCQFLLYLFFVASTARTCSPLQNAFYAVQWFHGICSQPSPTSDLIVATAMQGLRRTLAQPAKKKKALSVDQARQLLQRFAHPTASLYDLQMAVLVALGFSAFLRWDELSRMVAGDIYIQPKYLAIFIESRKNDQFREGHWVFIIRTDSPTWPVKLTERFLSTGKHSSDDPVFRKVTRHPQSGTEYLRGSMTYSRAREHLAEMLSEIGLNAQEYGLHSLRAGGASAAANAGVKDRLFRRHGGWRSEKAKDGYLEESLKDKLAVSASLQL